MLRLSERSRSARFWHRPEAPSRQHHRQLRSVLLSSLTPARLSASGPAGVGFCALASRPPRSADSAEITGSAGHAVHHRPIRKCGSGSVPWSIALLPPVSQGHTPSERGHGGLQGRRVDALPRGPFSARGTRRFFCARLAPHAVDPPVSHSGLGRHLASVNPLCAPAGPRQQAQAQRPATTAASDPKTDL